MNELRYGGNLFLLDAPGKKTAYAVTTNGVRKAGGLAVMGAGIAKYARDRYPGIDRELGKLLASGGNRAYDLGTWSDPCRAAKGLDPGIRILSYPTKHHWKDPSDPELVAKSARELVNLADALGLEKIYLPAPGCALGRLDYASQVRGPLSKILDGRFTVALDPALYDALRK